MKIEIVNKHKLEDHHPWDVPIHRQSPSPLSNPYRMKYKEDRDEVCICYRQWFDTQLRNNDPLVMDELHRLLGILRTHGKLRLICVCAPKRCHGETIRRWLISMTDQPRLF